IVLSEPTRRIEADRIRPVWFGKGNELVESLGACDLDASREKRARDTAFPIVLQHRHPDDSGSAGFEEQTGSADNVSAVLRHEEVMTCGDKGRMYIVQIRIQRWIDKSEMLAESLKHNVPSCVLVPGGKLSNDQVFWYSCRLLATTSSASRM